MMRYVPTILFASLLLLWGCSSGPGEVVDSAEPPFAVLTLKVAG